MEALGAIQSPPHAMSLSDRKLLERFSELYDKVWEEDGRRNEVDGRS